MDQSTRSKRHRLRRIGAALTFAAALLGGAAVTASPVSAASSGTWTFTGAMVEKQPLHSLVKLADGRVLAAGGLHPADGTEPTFAMDTAEIYDPEAEQWSLTGSMNVGRSNPTLTLLPDGKVLAAGGRTVLSSEEPNSAIASAEIFDPATDWTLTGSLDFSRIVHGAVLLNDGTVLVAGGAGGRFDEEPKFTAEVYDPAIGEWTQTESTQCVHQSGGAANMTALPDGTVLMPGADFHSDCGATTAEIFTPGPSGTGTWALTGSMNLINNGGAVLLDEGTVLATASSTLRGSANSFQGGFPEQLSSTGLDVMA